MTRTVSGSGQTRVVGQLLSPSFTGRLSLTHTTTVINKLRRWTGSVRRVRVKEVEEMLRKDLINSGRPYDV